MSEKRPIHVEGDINAKVPIPTISVYSGDEGRDRLRAPSINAPHTEAEAQLAVLGDLRRAVEDRRGEVRGKPYQAAPESVSGRTAAQAQWLNDADRAYNAAVLKCIDAMAEGIIERVESAPACGIEGHPTWAHDCAVTEHVAKRYAEED